MKKHTGILLSLILTAVVVLHARGSQSVIARFVGLGSSDINQFKKWVRVQGIPGRIENSLVRGAIRENPHTGAITGNLTIHLRDRFDQSYGENCSTPIGSTDTATCELVDVGTTARTRIKLENIHFWTEIENDREVYKATRMDRKIMQHMRDDNGNRISRDLSDVSGFYLKVVPRLTGTELVFILPGHNDLPRADTAYTLRIRTQPQPRLRPFRSRYR